MAADPLTSATVDDLLNFDSTDDEAPFGDKPSKRRNDKPTLSPRGFKKRKPADGLDDALGLDTEVQIKKKRKPIAKLDEARLLSAPGLPKLRADARSGKLSKKLRLKGKGHEFSDVARLLSYYQLWLDDLYPRAKFADGLQLVEKAGHSRRMQIMRKEWIDEGKPEYVREKEAKRKVAKAEQENDDMLASDQALMSGGNNEPSFIEGAMDEDSLFLPDARSRKTAEDEDTGLPEDDELDALLAEQEIRPTSRPPGMAKRVVEDDSEGEDDLDALLAQQETRRAPAPFSVSDSAKTKNSPFGDDDDDDEDMDDLDALLAEQSTRLQPGPEALKSGKDQPSATQNKSTTNPDDDEDLMEDDDELEALIAEQEARQGATVQALPQSSPTAKSSAPAVQESPADADGADMFSSSPVRGTAASRLELFEEHDDFPIRSAEQLQSTSYTPMQASTGTEEDGAVGTAHVAKPPAVEKADGEESQGLDAGDMFSSSPVQNED